MTAPAAPAPTPTTTSPAPARSRVAVAACPTYAPTDVAAALAEVLAAVGGLGAFVRPGQTVLLKPNLLSPRAPDEAVTTHPELVRQLALLCARAGAARIWVGDSPAGGHREATLWARTGLAAALAGTPATLVSWETRQVPRPCAGELLAVPEWLAAVDVIISLPKLKTHSLTMLTGALKNVFGLVAGQAKANCHAKYPSPQTMSRFLVEVHATLRPHLSLMDAVVAMEGHGPANGRPLPVGVLLASVDAVALDAVACAPLRLAPAAVPMIRLAAARGLGRLDAAGIEAVGSGVERLRAARMKPSLARYLKLIPEPAFGLLTRLCRLRPVIQNGACVRCGICSAGCPAKAIAPDPHTGFPRIAPAACIVCFCCMESCPHAAIVMQMSLAGTLPVAYRAAKKGPVGAGAGAGRPRP